MNITFTCLGLVFEAEVDYTKGQACSPFCRPDEAFPDEYSEMEITALQCRGDDAMFLMTSYIGEEIDSAAWDAVIAQAAADRDSYLADRAADRDDDRRSA